ncbi:MAG: DNA primase [Bacteroidetes bacterium]|nr:MAG: DNA primase [Bacteroidota bacterium]
MEISEIKTSLTITRVLAHYNHQADKNHRINCPFHPDKTPSMQVYEKTNTVYCFSSNCKTHGKSLDVIDFIMHKEEITKHAAILKAVEMLGGTPAINKQRNQDFASEAKQTQTLPSEALAKEEILSKIFNYFRNGFIMRKESKARNYLESRNLNIIKLQNLGIVFGYNSAQFHHRGKLNAEDTKAAINAGLMKLRNQGNTEFTTYSIWAANCVIFPLTDKKGNITGLYGRSTSQSNAPKAGKHFYLKSSKGLFYSPKQDTKKLIITESIIDFLSIYQIDEIRKQYDFLPIYGTNRLTEEHLNAIRELKNLQEIVFFLDGDKAGTEAIKKYSEELNQLLPKTQISQVQTPKDEDINSLLQGHSEEIFTHLLDNRKFLFSSRKLSGENKKPVNPVQTKDAAQLNTKNQELLTYTTTELKITILGGIRISGLDRLKVTLKVIKQGDQNQIPVRYSLDLYHAKQVEQLTETIAQQLEISSSKAMKIISKMTTELEIYRQKRMEALKPKTAENYKMSDEETHAAVRYLKSKKLLTNTKNDIATSGIIGEQSNAMTGFVVNLSRKRSKPLHVMYLGSSGSGKTHLQEGLAQLIPKEDRIEATGLSDQSLYYEGLKLKGKILFIEDLDGAENVMYIIRELQSKGRITKRVAWRDNKGNTKTVEVVAEGPVVISSCTTKEKLYEDNANRCILLYIDQSREQDKKVMDYMKSKSTGKIIESEQEAIRKKMQNLQRMLKPIKVYNPFANLIELPPEVFKPRRSLPLLLGFIESLTFYHQYQRQRVYADSNGNPIEPYIQSTVEDIENSFALMKEVLFSKSDELSKAAREFLERLKKEVKQGDTFYTKEIRKKFRISASGSQRYMSELQSYGYVKIKNGNRYRGFEYSITDYSEYENLRQSIEKLFEAILLNIRKISSPVAQSSPVPSLGYLNTKEPVV